MIDYDKYKRNCFWLSEGNDMGAILHFCDWQLNEEGRIWPFYECPEDCDKYITREEAKTVILSWLENNRNK